MMKIFSGIELGSVVFPVLTFIGGLAMFLFGMSVMGDALEKKSGGKLEGILQRLTSNKYKGLLLGLLVTAVIQSSSATTVMVVGFVNSGIMQLSQAIGVIFGANIGTTITSWILSLSGISSDNFFMTLLKPSSFSPILALIGIVYYSFVKDAKKKDVGAILLGFAILMFGMETMSDTVKPLSDVPAFGQFMLMFSNPILGILMGAIITAIIQSSSASVGILQAFAATGSLTFSTAIPIIMGQNIGTCITALLSSIGTSTNAKRAAFIHLYFNVVSTIIIIAVFYTLNTFLNFAFLAMPISAFNIAIVHSLFNVLATIIMLPLTNLLEKLACATIKGKDEDRKFVLLDERFLSTPSFALQQCKTLIYQMADIAQGSVNKAIGLIDKYDDDIANQIIEEEKEIDTYEDKLGTYLVAVSSNNLSFADSKEASTLLHCIGDFERIGDHALNIMQAADEINSKGIVFSDEAIAEIKTMASAVNDIVILTKNALKEKSMDLAVRVEPLEQVVDKMKHLLKAKHIDRLQKGECTTNMGFVFSDLITNFERISDHCSNIAVSLIQSMKDGIELHNYLNSVKNTENAEFNKLYNEYETKYSLN